MKLFAVVALAGMLVGCATRPVESNSVPLEQIQARKYTTADCPNLDQNIKFLETQLRLRGLQNADPTKLSESNRVYNGTVRVAIWNLRIGCTNPTRFSKK
jgi:hypothetical protein